MAGICVEAGGLAGGGLVGAGDAGRLAGLAGGGDEVARIGVEADDLPNQRLIAPRNACGLVCRGVLWDEVTRGSIRTSRRSVRT